MSMDAVLRRLGYTFDQPSLLRQALTHRSYGAQHNERLEFIGDAALDCIIAVVLYERFPGLDEGELSRARANLVNRDTLSALAQGLALQEHVLLGEGETKSGGAQRSSILADSLEAIVGAVFLDGGFAAARKVVEAIYADMLAGLDPERMDKDPKTRLQEFLQAKRLPLPAYTVTKISGEQHNQTFEVACRVDILNIDARGSGTNRRAAEQEAAEAALDQAVHR